MHAIQYIIFKRYNTDGQMGMKYPELFSDMMQLIQLQALKKEGKIVKDTGHTVQELQAAYTAE